MRLENNVIAYNGQRDFGQGGTPVIGSAGVTVFPETLTFAGTVYSATPKRVSILNNKIYCNGKRDLLDPVDPQCGRGLGIDFSPIVWVALLGASPAGYGDGPTLNDLGDGDTGPNEMQNFPVLDADRSIQNPALVIAYGVFNSEANKAYRLQFFSNRNSATRCLQLTAAAPAGYFPEWGCTVDPGFSTAFLASQGEVLIGETTLTTDGNGNASFKVVSKIGVPVGSILTATATRLDDITGAPLYTSEFSQAIAIDPKGSDNAYVHANGAAGGDGGSGGASGEAELDLWP